MTNSHSPGNHAAEIYGYARIGLSTPDGNWEFGNNGIINDDYPMPCSDEDSKDIPYLKTVFKFVEQHQYLDSTRMWAEGFSQNSVFSAYIGHCFRENVLGIFQGGSGLALHGSRPYFPGIYLT